ncbi:cubilin homolog [Musca autumnalis]|uniref:cubilin homolog n=1 Tax=Musca autumnalis TaxID=221902 RepID=UPI003CF35E17
MFVTDYVNNKNGFRAEYSHIGCGQIITADFGLIKSPNYPYSGGIDCEWYIYVEPGQQIVFTSTEYEMGNEIFDCNSNTLIVKESKNSTRNLMHLCRSHPTQTNINSPANRLYIRYVSSPSRGRKFFRAVYQTRDATCGGEVEGASGTISSPNYPLNTTEERSCTWQIRVPNALQIRITITDSKFNQTPNCEQNYLKISGLPETNIKTICPLMRTSLVFNGRRINVEYKNQQSQLGSRFLLHYQKECGGKIEIDSGLVAATSDEICTWTFNMPAGNSISLNILELDCVCTKTDNGTKTCDLNGLKILRRLADNNVDSNGNICENFQSNMVFETKQLYLTAWRINFRAKFSTEQHACGGDITAARGALTSPSYPSSYPANVECTWTIKVTFGNTLQLEFEDLDMPKSEHCHTDYLEVRRWSNYKTIGIYCGNVIPENVIKSHDTMSLVFRSSEASSGKGFKLKWSYAHLSEFINETSGFIESPPISLLSNADEPYAWRIMIPRQQYVGLYFNHYRDGLKLYDGYDNTALPVEISSSPWYFVSSSNVVYFETDIEIPNYFQLSWNVSNTKVVNTNTTTSKCHVESIIKPYATENIYSPGFPSGYKNNLDCDWIFKPFLKTDHVVGEIYLVKLEVTDRCTADYLKISSTSDLLQWREEAKLCDSPKTQSEPYHVYAGKPNLKLNLVTDASGSRMGFAARIGTACGSNLTQSVGFIEGDKIMRERSCLWRIIVRPGKRILLQLDFASSIPNNPWDCKNYALLYDGFDENAPLLPPGKICNTQNVTQLQLNSSSNYLIVKYSLWRDGSPKRWNLTYREYSECNEEYRLIPEAPAINISTPNYPNVPQPHSECEWRIVAPRGELIDIKFLPGFDMNTKYFDQEYVELFDGATALAKSLGKYNRMPPLLKTTQNMLYIHYVTHVSEPRSGFKVQLSIGKCCGLFTRYTDIITSPGYPHPSGYPSHSQCDYVVNIPTPYRLRLIVQDISLPYSQNTPQTMDHLEVMPILTTDNDADVIPSIFIYGNTTIGSQFDLNVNKVIIRFRTFAKTSQYRGFQIKYNRFGGQCHREFEGESGPITLHFPIRSQYSSHCRLKITVPKGLSVRMEFLNIGDIIMPNASKSVEFRIYNDHDMQSLLRTFNVINYDPNTIIKSTDNTMVVQVHIPAMMSIYKSLQAHYYSDSVSYCPPNIDESKTEGHIEISNWDPHFKEPYYCKAQVKLNFFQTIVFNISRLEVKFLNAQATSGLTPLLSFHDDQVNANYRENLTQVLYPQTQRLGYWILMQTDNQQIQRLSMSYRRHACGGNYVVKNGLTLKQPEIRELNYGAIMCMWSLTRPFNVGRMEYRLVGNFSFSDSCDREFIMIKEQRWRSDPLIKFCRDTQNASVDYKLTNSETMVIYQAENYTFPSTQFYIEAKKAITCGSETVITEEYVIVQVDRHTYRNNEECSWIFKTRLWLYLQVKFYGRFFIENSENCTRDYLEIQRMEDGVWIPDVRYCGRDSPPVYNARSSQIQVIFRTNANVTADGFSFLVLSHCSLIVNVTSSSVQRIGSPQPMGYRNQRMECEYIFQSNETKKLISVRALTEASYNSYLGFTDTRRTQNSGICFTIYKQDNSAKELPGNRRCENDFEERAYKYLRFTTTTNDIGIYMIEYGFDSCGDNITTSPYTIYPLKHESRNSYTDNMNCVWYVTAPEDHSIVVRFKYFETEAFYDHLSIYSGRVILREKRVIQLTGNLTSPGPTVIVDHNEAVINAISDASSSARGFEALIVFVRNCNERISLTVGNSPVNLARNYRLNDSGEEYMCLYRISAPKGYRIRVDIKKLAINNGTLNCSHTGESGRCSADSTNCNFVEIFDSIESKTSMGKFCRTSNATLISSYNEAALNFIASNVGQLSFEIILTMEKSICGIVEEYTLGERERYTLMFPQNPEPKYTPNVHCSWHFILKSQMLLRFNYIDLQNVSQISGKCQDYVEVTGDYNSFQFCGHISNYILRTTEITSTNGKLEVIFHSDAAEEGKGFELVTESVNVCNQTYNDLSGNLEYSMDRPGNNACQTIISVPDKYNLNFYINRIDFINNKCNNSYFRITDNKTNSTIYDRCQNSNQLISVFTTTNVVRIEAYNKRITSLTYSTTLRTDMPGCGGTFNMNEGSIVSPNYEGMRKFTNCVWTVRVPAPNSINLHFVSFNMGPITNCHLDNLQIYEIMSDGSEKLLKTLCGPEKPGNVKSTSNQIRIISKTSPNIDGSGWSLMYIILNTIK